MANTGYNSIVIRHSTEADRDSIVRLAQLDEKDVPSGDSLLAYVGDELRAALPLGGCPALADPFHLTRDIVELLRLRAQQERGMAA